MLNYEQTINLKCRYNKGERLKDLAIEYGVSQDTVNKSFEFHNTSLCGVKGTKKDHTLNVQLVRRAELRLFNLAHEVQDCQDTRKLKQYENLLGWVATADAHANKELTCPLQFLI